MHAFNFTHIANALLKKSMGFFVFTMSVVMGNLPSFLAICSARFSVLYLPAESSNGADSHRGTKTTATIKDSNNDTIVR